MATARVAFGTHPIPRHRRPTSVSAPCNASVAVWSLSNFVRVPTSVVEVRRFTLSIHRSTAPRTPSPQWPGVGGGHPLASRPDESTP